MRWGGAVNILFLHQNFPGQLKHPAGHLAANPANRIVALCQEQAPRLPRMATHIVYRPARRAHCHHYLRTLEEGVLNGQAVARALLKLKQDGFVPDIVIAHPGWGEALYVKDVFPQVPLLGLFEFFYHADGADANFDAEFPLSLDSRLRIRTRNALHLLNLQTCDAGVNPTRWQKQLHPVEYHHKLAVIHEGVDSQVVAPNPSQAFRLPDGSVLTRNDEVITYVARNLEPYRGFHQFMRAVPRLCERRPKARILIVGGDDVSYGPRAPNGKTWREHLLSEVSVDPTRVHFLGRLPYAQYLRLLQVSSVHVYLTVPFVLSSSMLEAMSAGCLVVGSNTAPVQEVIEHGKNGLLVDFFSPGDIADAVEQVLEHPDRMQALRDVARQTIIERYEVRQSLRAYGKLIGALLNGKKMAGHTNVPRLRGHAV